MANPTSYIVQWNDSLQSIALKLTGDESNWRLLQAYNGSLQWPFISNNAGPYATNSPYAPVAASGTVTVTGSISQSWTVPVGFLFGQPPLRNGSYQVTYAATSSVTGGSGTASVSVPVACTQTGSVGNCAPGAISVVLGSGLPSGTTVTNSAAFTNGAAPNVLGPGSTLLIPPSFAASETLQPPTEQDWLTILGGTALFLGSDGDFAVTPAGKLQTVTGASSLTQNWSLRVLTQRGEMPMHQDLGTETDALGVSGAADVSDLIIADIRESIRQDPRVQDVQGIALTPQGTSLQVTAIVTPISSDTTIPISVLLGGG